ncbi:LysR family transcriptional regulator [Brevibacillus ginsengisoli]|uniref:LysR family transcriptional regulator n=1 Tax=Brevibacillus ginsengisoli TaxID=363854 RepID=UPI003CFB5E41
MTLIQIKVFLSVVETGSFSKAGDLLGMSQPAISHAISGLEAEVGVTLLNRSRNGITLTEIGEQILPHMREMMRYQECVYQEVDAYKGLTKGTVRIGSFPSISASWMPGIIHTFQQAYPAIQLILAEGTYEEIEDWIQSGHIHVGFVTLPVTHLDVIPLIRDELAAILPATHPLGVEASVPIEKIVTSPFIMPNAGCQTLIKQAFTDANITPDIRYELRETSTILQMVESNVGISILPNLALASRHSSVLVKPTTPVIYREIGLAVRSLKLTAPAVQAFIQHVQQWIADSADSPSSCK